MQGVTERPGQILSTSSAYQNKKLSILAFIVWVICEGIWYMHNGAFIVWVICEGIWYLHNGAFIVWVISEGIWYMHNGAFIVWVICEGIWYLHNGAFIVWVICEGIWYLHNGALAHSDRSCHDRWLGKGRLTSGLPPPRIWFLWIFTFGDTPLCMQLLLTTKGHSAVALWMSVRLSAATPASLNGCGVPWGNVSRPFSCNSQINCLSTLAYMAIVSCFGMWNSYQVFARNFQSLSLHTEPLTTSLSTPTNK
jgi:hypothetical protein